MTQPKRHHWWPQVQSRYWTCDNNLVHVSRQDGTWFRANPNNIGVESELYTRFKEDDSKDTSIEDWFATQIDSPARTMIEYLCDPSNVRRRRFRPDAAKAQLARRVGFRVYDYIEFITLNDEIRQAVARYVSALLVRHPAYLAKLIAFHERIEISKTSVRNRALDNMLYLYNVYEAVVRKSVFILCRRSGASEFIYADGGLVVDEPWRQGTGIPFDIHAPLTPDISLEVLPMPFPEEDLSIAYVSDATNQGVARMNRIVLGSAERFVFTRQTPPLQFISKYFGVSAPENIGYRFIDGRFETKYEPSRV